jgi:hypothetical protein
VTRAALIAAYLAALLAVDTQVDLHGQLALGALTWVVLIVAAWPLTAERRAQVAVVICAATVAELTGSILWGVYSYRLHNLPTFVPPAHGLVFMAGLALSEGLRRHSRALVLVAGGAALLWGVLGLTVLSRLDAAGGLGIPLLLAFLWRSRARAAYAGVFLVVAALELYGTAIGTWRWAEKLPGLGIPDGNPPSGVASGYVWFDVIALLFAPWVLAAVRTWPLRRRPRAWHRTGLRWAVAGQPCDRRVGGCELRPLTILLGLTLRRKAVSALPLVGEVKYLDEPPEGGGINQRG